MRIDLPITVIANKDARGRIRNYTASLGAVSVDFTTEKGARDALARQLVRVAEDVGLAHRMLWSLDGEELWITAYDGGAWYYRVIRRREGHYARDTRIGCWASRDEAEDRLREHWYAANVDPIVRGIVSLVGWIDWECSRCAAVRYARESGRCPNPGCGREDTMRPWVARKRRKNDHTIPYRASWGRKPRGAKVS